MVYTLSKKLAPATRQLISSTLSRMIPSFSLNKSANLNAPPPVAFRNTLNQIVSSYVPLLPRQGFMISQKNYLNDILVTIKALIFLITWIHRASKR